MCAIEHLELAREAKKRDLSLNDEQEASDLSADAMEQRSSDTQREM